MHKNTTYHSSNSLNKSAKLWQRFPTLPTVERTYILKHLHDYFPYGKTLREWYATNEDTERFQTTHHQRDTETTLDHRGARFYDADVGRFLSLDPLAAEYPTESTYLYVGGNPIAYIDIDGKFKWPAGKESEYAKKYPTLTKYLQGDYFDYISGQRGVITELLHSDLLVNSLIRNSWNTPLSIIDIMDAVFYGHGPTLDVYNDPWDGDGGNYVSRYQQGRIRLSATMLNDLESATTDLDKQAVLTVIVSTLFHEYLELLGNGDSPLIGDEELGAIILENEVWGINLGTKEDGKRAIDISKGKDEGGWFTDFDGKKILINDNSAIPTVPDNSRIIKHTYYRY